jgi:hypothetical protein
VIVVWAIEFVVFDYFKFNPCRCMSLIAATLIVGTLCILGFLLVDVSC